MALSAKFNRNWLSRFCSSWGRTQSQANPYR